MTFEHALDSKSTDESTKYVFNSWRHKTTAAFLLFILKLQISPQSPLWAT